MRCLGSMLGEWAAAAFLFADLQCYRFIRAPEIGRFAMGQRIAVLGMGQMGSGMAGRLADSGHEILGYDINPQIRATLQSKGVAMADSLAAAVGGREIILTSLPDPGAVQAAWLGAGGLVASADKDSLCIEL